MNYKTIVLIIIFLAGIFTIHLIAGKDGNIKQKAVVGLDAPSIELDDINNKNWKLSELKGKVVLLNFWATWCDSCKLVNSSIQNIINSKKDGNIVYISILYKDEPSRASDYMKKNGFDFPVLIDNKNIASIYGIGGIPETFIINKKGIIKEKIAGPINWDSPRIRTALDQLVSE